MRIIAFGESTVAGAGDPAHLGWIGRALAGRREVTLYNLGIRGATSTKLAGLWRREAEARLTDAEPCRIVFGFGVNDTWVEGGAPQVTPAQSLLNTRALLLDSQTVAVEGVKFDRNELTIHGYFRARYAYLYNLDLDRGRLRADLAGLEDDRHLVLAARD